MQELHVPSNRDIDDIIKVVKEHDSIAPLQQLYIIAQIEKPPTQDDIDALREHHQFKSKVMNDEYCLCGESWGVPVHS